MQANMKNQIEASRLQLNKKVYDRQQSHAKFLIEKEQRKTSQAMRLMRDTSGISQHSLRPGGPHDTCHQKSPYFQGCRAVDETRLHRWRVMEKQYQRRAREEKLKLHLPWEKDPYANVDKSFKEVTQQLGYGQEHELYDLLHRVTAAQLPEKENMFCSKRSGKPAALSTNDVFECLRDFCPQDNTSHIKKANRGLEKTANDGFGVSKWERAVVDRYKNMVTSHNTGEKIKTPRRPKSAAVLLREHRERLGGYSEDNDGEENDDPLPKNKPKAVKLRPHSAGTLRALTQTGDVQERSAVMSARTAKKAVSITETATAMTVSEDPGITNSNLGDSQQEKRQAASAVTTNSRDRPRRSNKVSFSEGDQLSSDKVLLPRAMTAPTKRKMRSVSESDLMMGERSRPNTRHNSTPPSTLQRRDSGIFASPTPSNGESHSVFEYSDEECGKKSDKIFFLGRYMRQWQRDLLIEAPPGLYTPKSPVKVNVVMSKAQRTRALERLVGDNTSDLKTLVDKEYYRRLQSRVNVFLAVSSVQEAVRQTYNYGDK